MSNRDVAPPGQARLEAMLKDYGDRLAALENRRLQGALSIQSASLGSAVIGATSTAPFKLRGSETWSQDVEYLGQTGIGRTYGTTGDHALVTREARGRIVDICPKPYMQIYQGAIQSIGSTVVVPIVWTGASLFGTPYSTDAMYAGGQIIVPVHGIYSVMTTGGWPNVVAVKGRVVIVQLSTDGGANWPTMVADGRPGINSASLGQDVTLTANVALLAGWRLRVAVIHDEVGSLNYTPIRFSLSYLTGYTNG